ncbi:hypothetical protein UFOVP181_86 [uncultured Caudovirales phage]|uniref:Uncharacterized protein n=1 Tax=uncultured Caudovirales phage TaxID=2100421 RepID=A0A6J5KTN0_9CAUD|nr:hypothetical protein UFOVP57_76 [uncultured Caudovirales phage]CAB5208609.1 hypothetical protein UFOVP181_86 [uncultured Caudovirales phage]
MADLYNTDLGGNTRQAHPSSLFGTRDLVFIALSLYEYNLYTDNSATGSYRDSDSLYSKIVTAVQEVAELYYLGAPSAMAPNSIIFAISRETAEWFYSNRGDNNTERSTASTLGDALVVLLRPNGNDPYNIGDFDLREMEDTGFGIMPGNWIY